MKNDQTTFNEHTLLHDLKHYLPAQAPLKDFIHHNTLHAFQDLKFHDALSRATGLLGYKVYLSLAEYRQLYATGRIDREQLERLILEKKGDNQLAMWLDKTLQVSYEEDKKPRIGSFRSQWKAQYRIDLDSLVHPTLFRIICSYLDQGISIWNFPGGTNGFLASIRELEQNSFTSFFRTKRAKQLLMEGTCEMEDLLAILVGRADLYNHYVLDQQFAHPGWSGLVAVVEAQPHTLLDSKKISLRDLIVFEMLLEIDALDAQFGEIWSPLGTKITYIDADFFATVEKTDLDEVLALWQEAFEWSYYDQVLAGIQIQQGGGDRKHEAQTFQALFCIDDRECSIRRHVEKIDPHSETFGTPGHFNVEFYFQPEHSKFHTKVCPAPVMPKFLVKEIENTLVRKKEAHLSKRTHSLFVGWILTHTFGFWSAFKLFLNIFRPTKSATSVSSFAHMDKNAKLTIENKDLNDREGDLQIGFTVAEMTDRVEALLKSIGLVDHFAPIVYAIGHGSSSVNNTHYAGYDCGACSGRPGSVNARVISFMANHPEVRSNLVERGIAIPLETQFIGALHDTSRDEIAFFDTEILSPLNAETHRVNADNFLKALDLNAKERSRRFMSIDTRQRPEKIHQKILTRTVSLFEPRPELNHATNALCIVGRRGFSKGLYLDRRSFLNSFDYSVDPEGKYLQTILNAAAPVTGGINLEYYFSRVDNQKLGAGTKLPHNVMGLFGVANGIDGDLRPGLPSQMIEVHDPLRIMIIVEHFPEIVLHAISQNPATYQWFGNEWVRLVAVHPETKACFLFRDEQFVSYTPLEQHLETISDILPLTESNPENFPVYLMQQN
jgi:uncharacterized protein YbcC (UPF0753/DUF2309 family)